MFRRIKLAWKEFKRPKLYENYVEASYLVKFIRKMSGASVYSLNSAPGGRITTQFTYLGFVCFVFWYLLYFYCVYTIFSLDLTILRFLYETKLQRYGDEVERVSTTIYFLYSMWKLPFEMNGHCSYAQVIVDIDKAMERTLGETIDFAKRARSIFLIVIMQVIIAVTRILSVWASLADLKISIPKEKLFQVVYSDSLALITTAQYCAYLYLLKDRYRVVNKVLDAIDTQKSRDFVMVRGIGSERQTNMLLSQDKFTSEKIKNCGQIYGMLYNASETANKKFGLAITLTIFMCLILIILYLFYFMEATAAGLFHDFNRYLDFLVYVFWQIGFALGIIFLNVFFCENTVKEAKVTSFVTHKIINSDLNPMVRTEALHLSLQVLHQVPSFTARGLSKIDYVLLLEGSRTVLTFLVILLQFVADSH